MAKRKNPSTPLRVTKYKAKKKKAVAANEPMEKYGKEKKLSEVFKGITISTLEEQEEDTRRYSASLSPLERMAYLHQLIQSAYAHVLSDKTKVLWDKKIYLD